MAAAVVWTCSIVAVLTLAANYLLFSAAISRSDESQFDLLITRCMDVGEDPECLLISAFGNETSRRFGHEPDGESCNSLGRPAIVKEPSRPKPRRLPLCLRHSTMVLSVSTCSHTNLIHMVRESRIPIAQMIEPIRIPKHHAPTKLPIQHVLLYIAVSIAQCCGCTSLVINSGKLPCLIATLKPMREHAPTNMP